MTDATSHLLLKGLEEEVYTGTPDGEIVGLSHRAAEELEGFRTEPDARNAEFSSPPLRDYEEIGCVLMNRRATFRRWLRAQGDYTLIPGATLSTGDSHDFVLSDPNNDYYRHIRDTYGTRVVTASAHINIGLDDAETLIRAARLMRMEASLFLALTAASPFLDHEATGFHSTRWATFPHTPRFVPLFESHAHYTRFIEEAIADGRMRNTRHLWISARPNGPGVPHDIDRVELRVCDRIDDPQHMIAVTALFEARMHQLLDDPALDPLQSSALPSSTRADDLIEINDFNNRAVMRESLNATVRHWRDGRPIAVRDWLEEYFAEAMQTARERGFCNDLTPVRNILDEGNLAMRWIDLHARGMSVRQIIRQAITEMEAAEVEHRQRVC